MKAIASFALFLLLSVWTVAAQPPTTDDSLAVIRSTRSDGRLQSTYGIVHQMLKTTQPQLAYREGMTPRQFRRWQQRVGEAMRRLMQFPTAQPQQAPRCISRQAREGYTLEKWEFYPLPEAVATFLVLRPDSLTRPVPAVLCIPGSGRTKEGLAGEPGVSPKFTESYTHPSVCMAVDMVREGYVAVAVDNAAAGEMSDLEGRSHGWDYDYDVTSRLLLELGWSWLGYTSYLDYQVLQWMKQQPDIRRDRIVVSGFSLGTEPMMVLGAMDKDIYAFVYNDFLCQTQERAVVMTKPDANDRRPFPNSIRHLIPSYWHYFNFPDVVASLAPRPIILTEGGLDRDFRKLASAYTTAGHRDHLTFYHYPKYADAANRKDVEALQEGYDLRSYLDDVNVDPGQHYYKHQLILPWLRRILAQ